MGFRSTQNSWFVRLGTIVGLACVCAMGFAAKAAADQCPNASLRVGPSASLPDCRAYELVTPSNLGRTQDMAFTTQQDRALVGDAGMRLALAARGSFIEPGADSNMSVLGTNSVFARTPSGWVMSSVTTPEMTGEKIGLEGSLFTPDLAQIAFESSDPLDPTNTIYRAGPVGGPYATVVTVPTDESTASPFLGANAGTASVPEFSDLVFFSEDHTLLPPGPERELAEEALTGAPDLYEWSAGQLHLVNLKSNGELLNRCGAMLGAGYEAGDAINAVSRDGSRVFFTSPAFKEGFLPPGCEGPTRQLYMRLDGGETVEISAPEGVSPKPSERREVHYAGATLDGSKVFFTTTTVLTTSAAAKPPEYLYEYDTEAPAGQRLTLLASGVRNMGARTNPGIVVSEDGSTIYYETANLEIYRDEVGSGKPPTFVAASSGIASEEEPSYTTPGGDYLVFSAGAHGIHIAGPHGLPELVGEARGAGHNELYRYDALDGSVACVSCGKGVAPAVGRMLEPEPLNTLIGAPDSSPSVASISEDGQRVFFQTSAHLVPQDTNAGGAGEEGAGDLGSGAAVYEWEQEGSEEAPGVLCPAANGCTHLISSGEDVGPELFLGASASGDDVFFTSAAALAPQATPEFTNIYDARVDGGFASSTPACECLAPRGPGSPAPALGPGASLTFAGAGNPLVHAAPPPPRPRHRASVCARGYRHRYGRCLKARVRRRRRARAGR
jgi:hypothetical protein